MEETTTTVDTTVDTGAQEALPAQVENTADATTTTTDSPAEGASALPEVDEKLQSFAKGQGIDNISELSERELKLLKVARDNQAEFQRKSQKASELEKTFSQVSDQIAEQTAQQTGVDPAVLKRLQALEVNKAVSDFFGSHPEARQYEQDMIKVYHQKPYLGVDLDALYATALVQAGGMDAVKSQGKKEALSNLAHKQQATAPTGNATTQSSPKEKPFQELSIKEMEAKLGFVRM